MSNLYINDISSLEDFCQQYSGAQWLALDTEFMREKTYYPDWCLLQIATSDCIACIDIQVMADLSPLQNLLYSTKTLKILHAARQDLEIFYHAFAAVPEPVFDTQLAAALLGYRDQISYTDLVSIVLNIELPASQSRTNWLQRPLSAKQLAYAQDDVKYLPALHQALQQQLLAQNRLNWLLEDTQQLTAITNYRIDPASQWQRVKGQQKLTTGQLGLLQKLTAWREQQAMQRNLPRRWVLSDTDLLDLCQTTPEAIEELTDFAADSTALRQLLQQNATQQTNTGQIFAKQRLTAVQKQQLKSMLVLVQQVADAECISSSLLATRTQLKQLLYGEQNLPVLRGWRYDLLGAKLLAIVS